jgi:UDP-N-acetylglucosamine 2-epimerase (non-hydrolysing)
MNTKIAIILGSRAEYIKLFSLMYELEKRHIEYEFIHTGQHSIDGLIKQFTTKRPDIIINARDGFNTNTGGAMSWGIKIIPKLISYLKSKKDIKFVIIQGDTLSNFCGLICGRLANKQVCHVEAGLRSGNLLSPMPEEIIRQISDGLSNIKFAVSEKTKNRLKGNVYNVGNTAYESLHYALNLNSKCNIKFPKKYAVFTLHRHETLKNKKRLEAVINILSYIQIPTYFFINKNTRAKLEELGLLNKLKLYNNIYLVDPLEYSQFVHVLKNAQFVIGDSGGCSEECSFLNVPYVTLREETEREELLDRGDQELVGFDEDKAKAAIMKFSLPRKPYFIPSPYYNGVSPSKQIVDILLNAKEV